MSATFVTPEVRTVPTCSDRTADEHRLLSHLTATARKRKGALYPLVRGGLDDWSTRLGLGRDAIRLAQEALEAEGHLRWDDTFGWQVWIACTCERADSSRKTGDSNQVGERPQTRSASMLPSRLRRNKDVIGNGETPGQRPEISSSEWFDPTPTRTVTRRRVGDSNRALADFFERRITASARAAGIDLMPGAISKAVAGRHIKTMTEGGMTPAEVRSLIIAFGKQYRRWHKDGVDPAVLFASARRRLYAEQKKQAGFMTERNPDRRANNGRRYSTAQDILGDDR